MRALESRARSKVEDLASFSEFLATVAAAFVTVIELNLQSLGYFLRILELVTRPTRFVEGWAAGYIFHLVRDSAAHRLERQLKNGPNFGHLVRVLAIPFSLSAAGRSESVGVHSEVGGKADLSVTLISVRATRSTVDRHDSIGFVSARLAPTPSQ